MRIFSFIALSVFMLLSCQSGNNEEKKDSHKDPESVQISNFSFPELSQEAEKTVGQWSDLKTIFQILASIAPEDNSKQKIIKVNNQDSLFTIIRMPVMKSKADNIYRRGGYENSYENKIDTVFVIEKDVSLKEGKISWDVPVVKDIPHTISFKIKQDKSKYVSFTVYRERDKKNVVQHTILSDKEENLQNVSIRKLDDKWQQVSAKVISPMSLIHSVSIYIDQDEENLGFSICDVKVSIPVKNLSEIEKYNDKTLKERSIKSSYNALYYWLGYLEDQMNILWKKREIPQVLDTPQTVVRLRLFDTYVRELKDNVKNNPDLNQSQVRDAMEKIRRAFSDFIVYVNKIHSEDISEKMDNITQNK